jgi:hypothetical protein
MEKYIFADSDSGLPIQELPDVTKLVYLSAEMAAAAADMLLHKSDLAFALECLKLIKIVSPEPLTLQQALWRSALVSYYKCFGSGVRAALISTDIYVVPLALEAYEHLKYLRNKHIVHDENSFSQSIPLAALNNGEKEFKIEKIICYHIVLEQENYDNFHLLVSDAIKFVDQKFNELCIALTNELEKETYEELSNREAFSKSRIQFDTISKRRKK